MRDATLALFLLAGTTLAGCLGGAPPPARNDSDGLSSVNDSLPEAEPELSLPCLRPRWLDEQETTTNARWAGANPRAVFETSLGTFEAEIFEQEVPVTAANFLALSESGFYDGVLFHRVIGPQKSPPFGFMVQTGDPKTRDPALSDEWGSGGSDHLIPDEFHAGLRHNGAGVLSMANSGPNTGTSQFFVTLGPTSWLDDRHAIFGNVASGMANVTKIGDVPTDDRDRPLLPVEVTSIRVARLEGSVAPVRSVSGYAFEIDRTAAVGSAAPLLAVVKNAGNTNATFVAAAEVPARWGCATDSESAEFLLPAGQSRLVLVNVTPSEGAPGEERNVTLVVAAKDAPGKRVSIPFTIRIAELGSPAGESLPHVRGHYVVTLADGRVVDTSLPALSEERFAKYSTVYRDREEYALLDAVLGRDRLVPGFERGIVGVREGETRAVRIPAREGYGSRLPPECAEESAPVACALVGKDLVFQVTVVSAAAS